MNAKEAKIIQEAGIGPIIKRIRKIVERGGYDNYLQLSERFYLTDTDKKALKELGYTIEPYLDMGNDRNSSGGVTISWG